MLEMRAVQAEWREEINQKFSISAFRYIFCKAKFCVKKFVADCLLTGARTARDAERALSLWAYYSPEERSELILVIISSTESDAEHRAAYMLTRCSGLQKWFSIEQFKERATLITFLKNSRSIEHARSALR